MAKRRAGLKSVSDARVFKLHISLVGIEPTVWRRVLVPGHFSLAALHSVFQLALGWQMKHLYDFQIAKNRFAEPDEFDEIPSKDVGISISSALKGENQFVYNYDFGDDWRHNVIVEDVFEKDDNFAYPVCIGGENACPPEDCGSVPGYEELKQTISNPKHPGYEEMMQWLGGYFDPYSFDANRINRDMLWMIDWSRGPNDQGLYVPFNFENDEPHENNGSRQ